MNKLALSKAIAGCLLGTAVGDAIALPYEGLYPQRLRSLLPQPLHHRFFFNKGMVSDDTEQTSMVAQALIIAGGDEEKFVRALAWRLRFWLLALPAGVGKATLIACTKLWLGFPSDRSGTFSAGNGAAMRSGILGVCYGENLPQLRQFIKVGTRLTHRDPKAEWGAFAIAIAAYLSSLQTLIKPEQYLQLLAANLEPEAGDFLNLIESACESAAQGESGQAYLLSLGARRGVSGYVYRTVPVVIQVWLRHQQDFASALEEIIKLGGDTDTTAAILGGIIGAGVGKAGIPEAWQLNLWDYPRSLPWLERLAERLAGAISSDTAQSPLKLPIWAIFPRNLFFLAVVLWHGFRRLFPPY